MGFEPSQSDTTVTKSKPRNLQDCRDGFRTKQTQVSGNILLSVTTRWRPQIPCALLGSLEQHQPTQSFGTLTSVSYRSWMRLGFTLPSDLLPFDTDSLPREAHSETVPSPKLLDGIRWNLVLVTCNEFDFGV